MRKTILVALTAFYLPACSDSKEGKLVPGNLRAEAEAFEGRKFQCAGSSITEAQFADCMGVNMEILRKDQSGLHEYPRN